MTKLKVWSAVRLGVIDTLAISRIENLLPFRSLFIRSAFGERPDQLRAQLLIHTLNGTPRKTEGVHCPLRTNMDGWIDFASGALRSTQIQD